MVEMADTTTRYNNGYRCKKKKKCAKIRKKERKKKKICLKIYVHFYRVTTVIKLFCIAFS